MNKKMLIAGLLILTLILPTLVSANYGRPNVHDDGVQTKPKFPDKPKITDEGDILEDIIDFFISRYIWNKI